MIEGLPSLQAFSGCDAVSAFNGIGKIRWLSAGAKREEFMDAMKLLGESVQLNESLVAVIVQCVCHIYRMSGKVDINEVRYKMFCRDKTPHQLPPTRDELLQHIKRSNYQSYFTL